MPESEVLELFEEPPHPVSDATEKAKPRARTTMVKEFLQRRRGRKPTSNRAARAEPVDTIALAELEAVAVELTVNVVLPAEPEESVRLAGLSVQVGKSLAVPVPVNLTAQERLTVPEKPLLGAICNVSVAEPPGEAMLSCVADAVTLKEEPVPVKATDCDEPEALSVMVMLPVSFCAAVGE